jgi:Flp pilus assembly protein TadD
MFVAFFAGILISALHPSAVSSYIQARNTIEGSVTTQDHQPLKDVRVFLQNDGYSDVGTTYTTGSGRFRFANIASGSYYVVVEPGSTDYGRQSQRVDVRPFNERRGGGGEVFRVDIVLKPRKDTTKPVATPPAGATVVFYQQIPEEAKKEFEIATKSLEKGSFESAVNSLKRAVEIFPEYYDALELLGTEYVKRNDFRSALPLLTRAVEINRDGWRGFYSLGIAQYETNNRGEATSSLRRAVELKPDSPNTNMRLGIALMEIPETRGEAIQAMEKVTKLAKETVPAAYFYLGILYSKNDRYREAADALDHFLKIYPQAGERDKIVKMIEQLRQKAKDQSKK